MALLLAIVLEDSDLKYPTWTSFVFAVHTDDSHFMAPVFSTQGYFSQNSHAKALV